MKRGFTLVEALVVLAITCTVIGLLAPAITLALVGSGAVEANKEPPDSRVLFTEKHDGHLWVLRASGHFVHHPSCQCSARTAEAEK